MIDWNAEVQALTERHPQGMSVIVQILGPVPTPGEGTSEEEKVYTLAEMERTAGLIEEKLL